MAETENPLGTEEEAKYQATIDEILGKLLSIVSPDPDCREYENEVTKIANAYNAEVLSKACKPLLADLAQPLELRYKAFFALSVQYRTLLDYKAFNLLLSNYSKEFKIFHSLYHLQLMQDLEQIKNMYFEGTPQDLIDLLIQGIRNCKSMPDNAGVMHAYCDLEASIYEYSLLKEIHIEKDVPFETTLRPYLDKAQSYIVKSIQLDDYPKFYSTRARLCIQEKDYFNAYQYISKAIAKEPVPESGTDTGKYNMKILNYNMIKNSISNTKTTTYITEKSKDLDGKTKQFENKYTEFDEKLKAANIAFKDKTEQATQEFDTKLQETTSNFSAKLEESSTKSIEIIGFFSGIISFFISSIQIATNMTVHDAASLIALLMGSCIMAYTAFSVLLHNFETQYIKKCSVMAIIGLLIMLGGSFFGLFL